MFSGAACLAVANWLGICFVGNTRVIDYTWTYYSEGLIKKQLFGILEFYLCRFYDVQKQFWPDSHWSVKTIIKLPFVRSNDDASWLSSEYNGLPGMFSSLKPKKTCCKNILIIFWKKNVGIF